MDWTAILSGAGGALAVQLLSLMELHKVAKDKRPNIAEFVYWLPFLIGPLVGGFMCWAYSASGYGVKPLLGIHLGVSAPLILRAMLNVTSKNPELPTGA